MYSEQKKDRAVLPGFSYWEKSKIKASAFPDAKKMQY
jgi:hypothetical protein